MNIAISGVNGFVGGCLANYFSARGHTVTGIGRQEQLASFVDQKCRYLVADIAKPLKELECDVVIHSAALASDSGHYDRFYENNVKGTQNMLQAGRAAGNFIHISTSSVYSFGNRPSIETEAGKAFYDLSPYGRTKFLAEQEILNDQNIPFKTIFRPRAIYGVNDRLILPRLLKFVKGRYLILPKHITQRISLTHIDNLAGGIELSLANPQKNAVYNIADEEVYNLDHVISKLVSAVVDKPLLVKKVPAAIWRSLISLNQILRFSPHLSRFGSDQLTRPGVMDISRIKTELNYVPLKNMDNSYKEIADWIRNEAGWERYLEKYEQVARSRK